MDTAFALVRAAVRSDLAALEAGDLVLAACSGGADSLALTAALLMEAPKAAISVGVISVDHQLQSGSSERAAELVSALRSSGAEPAEVIAVSVGEEGGPEGAARLARYTALDEAADKYGAAAIYLAHTADDQAETVLLGLARGSGARSLAGMAPVVRRYRRPLLEISRKVVREAAWGSGIGIEPWEDPHNVDDRYLRPRVRHGVLPVMERELGPGVTEALVRSARLLRDDADALDAFADTALLDSSAPSGGLDAAALALYPTAVRTRVLRKFAIASGVSGNALSFDHVRSMDALVVKWRGQGPVTLPGGLVCLRTDGAIKVS